MSAAKQCDIFIAGAGPVGLMCAYLARSCGLSVMIADRSAGPLEAGRADALNARTLQLLELAGLFGELYPRGKPCNTSSVWSGGKFVSRQSSWWDALEGCLHRHFLMLGQSHVEQLLDRRLRGLGVPVMRNRELREVELVDGNPLATLADGERVHARFLIGADGPRSFVRERFRVPFEIVRPEIVWAVIDGEIDSDFPKVPEIIVFQAESSDVAWIPREGTIDRFYVRMDRHDFTMEEAVAKINRAMQPHSLRFRSVSWFSQFAVKESVAGSYRPAGPVFLAGDSCHVHSVNGGQGLNTGLADAFNLIWKLKMHLHHGAPSALLASYESERRPVAQSVIESSGKLVRSTKFSAEGTHALDYVKLVQQYSGNITGMGIRYGTEGLPGTRLFDFELLSAGAPARIYSLLGYSQYTLLLFGDAGPGPVVPAHVKLLRIQGEGTGGPLRTAASPYAGQAVLVRPDSYIEAIAPLQEAASLLDGIRFSPGAEAAGS